MLHVLVVESLRVPRLAAVNYVCMPIQSIHSVMLLHVITPYSVRDTFDCPQDGVQFMRFYEDQYDAERDDTRRTPQFIQAIQERVKGREGLTVLDIGTGPFALFALVAARAGAKKVYAVEGNPEAAERARNTIAEQEDVPEGVIEVIEGFSTAVTLPEKVDLVCAEIVGAFATQENICATISDAQKRHMKDASNPENYIPSVVQSWTAPVSYALHPVLSPKFEKLQGQPLTLNPRDRTLELISDPQVLEEINFAKPLPEGKQSKSLSFKVSRDRLRANYDAYYEALTTKEEVKAEDAKPLATQTTKSFSGILLLNFKSLRMFCSVGYLEIFGYTFAVYILWNILY